MSRRLLVTMIVGGGVIAVLVVILVAFPGRHEKPKTYLHPTVPDTGTGPVDSAPIGAPGRCTAVDIALTPEERAGGATFRGLIDAEPGSGAATAAGSVFLFMDLQNHVDYGPWSPAVNYLKQSAQYFVEHEGSLPARSDEVAAAASRIDRDLAAGKCR